MKKLEPNANKQLTRKWREENLHRHYNRLNQTKPTINCHNTVNFPHLVTKPKKNQMIEERCTEIEKNNMNLFHKMRAIIRTKHTQWRQKNMGPNAQLAPRERIGSAFSQGSMRSRGHSAKSNRSNRSMGYTDYNRGARSRSNASLRSERKRMQEAQLQESNRKQLRRLQDTKCSFDVLKWSKQEKERKKLLNNLKQYPEKPIAEFVTRPKIKNQHRQKSLAPIAPLSMNSPRLSRERSRGKRDSDSQGLTPRQYQPQHKKTTSVLPNRTRQLPFQITINNNASAQYNLPKRFASTRGKARQKSVRRQHSMQGQATDLQSYFPPNAYHSQLSQNQQQMQNSSFMPQPAQQFQASMLPPSSFRQIKSSEGNQNPNGMIPSPRSNRPSNRNRHKFINPDLQNQLNYNNFLQTQTDQQERRQQHTVAKPSNVYSIDSDVTTLRKPSMEQPNRGRNDTGDLDNSQRLTPQMFPDRKGSKKRGKGTANSSYRKGSNEAQMRRITKQQFETQVVQMSNYVKPKENLRQKPPLKQNKVVESNQPSFVAKMGIPIRSNKRDNDPPHQEFQVAITHLGEILLIIATNLRDQRDYFEIKVEGNEEIQRVLTKFRFSYLLISESLRIMNDVMVLLNPKMLEKETAAIIQPKLNEQSIDEPLKAPDKEMNINSGYPSDKGSLSIIQTQNTPPVEPS